jgi:hypothetical protein
MKLLKEAVNDAAFLKAGIFGFQGAGKTFTASQIAIGLHKYIKSTKPIAFVDTETGSSYVKPHFDKAGIKLVAAKTRAFQDLLSIMPEAENSCDILIIDSISHIWREFVTAYKIQKKRSFIMIQDWGALKENWQKYTDRYINSRLHIIMCGRAGNVFADVEDDDDSSAKTKWKAVKVGTKMSAETETGYEPSLLLEMTKVFDDTKGKGASYLRRCHVVKDRFDIIDSKDFDDPKFEDFLPHISRLNLGGEQVGIDETRTSAGLFENGDLESQKLRKRRDIALEELDGILIKLGLRGTSAESKKNLVLTLEKIFGTSSKTKIESLHPDKIEEGVIALSALLSPSVPQTMTAEEKAINDKITKESFGDEK